jgi:hypothetical protein
MTTYHNRTLFKLECDGCHKTIHPSETYATEYFNAQGENITVIQAYEANVARKGTTSKVHCALCRPFKK